MKQDTPQPLSESYKLSNRYSVTFHIPADGLKPGQVGPMTVAWAPDVPPAGGLNKKEYRRYRAARDSFIGSMGEVLGGPSVSVDLDDNGEWRHKLIDPQKDWGTA
jgi:hypothetical protein